jgi:hypothetical protein
MPDINRDDLGSAVLQHAIGESTRRGSGIKNTSTGNDVLQCKVFDCAFKLCSGSAHKLGRRSVDEDCLRGVDHPRGFRGRRTTDSDATGGDIGLGALARRCEATTYKFEIKSTASPHRW